MDIMETYELHYDFGNNYNAKISNLLNEILNGSNELFAKQFQNGEIGNVTREYRQMTCFILNIEEYLYYYKENQNFESILDSISDIKKISVLPTNNRGIYGQAIAEENTLLINPTLEPSSTLNHQERTSLYVAHELGHFVNAKWMNTIYKFLDKRFRTGNMNNEQVQLFYEGFSMLDEAIAQNNAEDFAYSFVSKERPYRQYKTRGVGVFNNEQYSTNYDFYGEFQMPTAKFAKTLRGIGKYESDDIALDILSKRALSPSFATDIIDEYTRDGQLENLFKLTNNMGIIKKAVYTSFGGDTDRQALQNSKQALENFYDLANKMREYRDIGQTQNYHQTASNSYRITPENISDLTTRTVEQNPGEISKGLGKFRNIIKRIKERLTGR